MSKTVTIPKEPTPGVLMSMALRYDHALGCPGYYDGDWTKTTGITHAQRLESTLSHMRKIYEEVARQGFYQDDKECFYASMAIAAQPAPDAPGKRSCDGTRSGTEESGNAR